jgi:transposase InsO family protein
VSRLSEVWKYLERSSISPKPYYQAMPFRGCGIDLIGQINSPSSKGHKFVLLATDCFTKWVEAIPLKKVTSENMVEFVKEHIIYRFGIPRTITTDQGTQFTSSEFRDFAESMGMKLLNSSPYYAQADGQVEASNRIMIKIIQKKIDQKPKRWHSVLVTSRIFPERYRSRKCEFQKFLFEFECLPKL